MSTKTIIFLLKLENADKTAEIMGQVQSSVYLIIGCYFSRTIKTLQIVVSARHIIYICEMICLQKSKLTMVCFIQQLEQGWRTFAFVIGRVKK